MRPIKKNYNKINLELYAKLKEEEHIIILQLRQIVPGFCMN